MSSVLIHTPRPGERRQRQLLLALLPVIAASAGFFGYQLLINIALCITFGLGSEALARILRRLPGRGLLRDQSILTTACLLGLCLPPTSQWWQLLTAMAFAVLLVKHAYGGAGQNPFHPAMAALLLLWLNFPDSTQNWPAELHFTVGDSASLDNSAWVWLNGIALLGGIYLLAVRAIAWQIPVGILGGLVIMSGLLGGAEMETTLAATVTQLTYGSTMLTAFFIATDPPSAAMTRLGKLYYGLLIGGALFSIRLWGDWPEGYAVAVVLGNFFAPLLDQLAQRSHFGNGRQPHRAETMEPSR